MNQYDIIIVGGGIVGLSFAHALRDSGLRIALIEAHDLHQVAMTQADSEFALRVSSITPASQRLFAKLGAWPLMQQQRVTPYYDMRVWDGLNDAHLHFSSFAEGLPQLGFLIENRVMQYALWQGVQAANNIDVVMPVKAESVAISDTGVCLALANQQRLYSRLIVAADGAHSWLRQQLDFAMTERSYEHTAIVATVRTEKSHAHTAWQRFLPTGPLAFLPLADTTVSSIVWSSDTACADALLQMPDIAFNQALTRAFDARLGRCELLSQRASFPLIYRHANTYVKPRVALMGDAAHTIHPLAGQGINLGLADAASLAEVILDAQQRQADFASLRYLKQYQGWRLGYNHSMALAMRGFQRVFASQLPVMIQLRWQGIKLLEQCNALKSGIMQFAMGNHRDSPRLMRRC